MSDRVTEIEKIIFPLLCLTFRAIKCFPFLYSAIPFSDTNFDLTNIPHSSISVIMSHKSAMKIISDSTHAFWYFDLVSFKYSTLILMQNKWTKSDYLSSIISYLHPFYRCHQQIKYSRCKIQEGTKIILYRNHSK